MSRPEVLTETDQDYRQVPVQIWYPAEDGTGTPVKYFPNLAHVSAELSASGEVAPAEVFGLRFIRSHERQEASISTIAASYPVILLSPGNGTNIEFYTAIADEFASFGYIVIGLNHPYDVAAVTLQDSNVAQFVEGPFELQARQPWVKGRIDVRTEDVLFVLDKLDELNANEQSPLAGRLDLSRVGIMGHSLGGVTATQACLGSSKLRACLNFDGLLEGGPFAASRDPVPPDQPFMLITKELQMHPAILALFEGGPSERYRVVTKGATHDNFTDGPLLLPSFVPLPNKADGILSLIRAYTLAFFDQSLNQQPSPLLEAPFESQDVLLEIYSSQ